MEKAIEINLNTFTDLSDRCNAGEGFIGVGDVDGPYAEFFILSKFKLNRENQFTTEPSGTNVKGIITPGGDDYSLKVQRLKSPVSAPLLYSDRDQTTRDMSGIRFNRTLYFPPDLALRDGLYTLIDWLTLKFDKTARSELSTTVNQPQHIRHIINEIVLIMDASSVRKRAEGRPGGAHFYRRKIKR